MNLQMSEMKKYIYFRLSKSVYWQANSKILFDKDEPVAMLLGDSLL